MTPKRPKPPMCMVCNRALAVVQRGKALYCRGCADVDPAEMDRKNAMIAKLDATSKRAAMGRHYGKVKGGGAFGHATPGHEHSS